MKKAIFWGALCALLLSACGGGQGDVASLSALSISGASGRAMYPPFAEGTKHYAVGCNAQDALTVSAISADPNARVSVNRGPTSIGSASASVAQPTGEQDIVVSVDNGPSTTKYTLHCLAADFPKVEIVQADAAASTGLLLMSPSFTVNGAPVSYLVAMDNAGVPQFRRKISGSVADFKRHPDGTYSYALRTGTNPSGIPDNVIVLLDARLTETGRVTTRGLTQTDDHDFLLTPQGNRIFISYHTTVRNMIAFGLSATEPVGDSVIQEVTPAGTVVFQWSTWDHIDLNDCKRTGFTGFPKEYAHVNSLDLAPDGAVIASFRGCGQILKIERPSGRVIWYLGGSRSNFTITGDRFNEFCGQHTVRETSTGALILFDNGIFCIGDRQARFGQFSRLVEYRLNTQTAQAIFVRDYALGGTYREFTRSQGSAQVLANGNWLASWGNGPAMSVTEVTPGGIEVFAARLTFAGSIAVSYRALRDETLTFD